MFTPKKCLGLKKIQDNFFKKLKKRKKVLDTKKLLGIKNIKHLFISVPKCIELNS